MEQDQVLEEVAVAAEEVASEQREIAREARTMQAERRAGRSWAAILDRAPEGGPLARMRRSRDLLSRSLGRLTHLFASGLAHEGASRRAIAQRLGVTHQRITAILRSRPHQTS